MIETIVMAGIIIILTIMLYLGFRLYVFMIIGIAMGVLLSNKITQYPHKQQLCISENNNIKLVLAVLRILFFIFVAVSIFIVYKYSSYTPPTKPVEYYVITAITSGLLCGSIFIKVKLEKRAYSFEIFQIFLLATITYFSTQLVVYPYSGIGSIDTINNIFRVSKDISIIRLINEGHIPPGIRYSYFPGHYLIAYITPLVGNFNPELMYYYLGGFIGTLVIPSTYIIGKRVIRKAQFAIMIPLITTIGLDYYNYWISHPHQFTYAFPLAVFSFVALVLYMLTADLKHAMVMMVIYTMLVISHDHTTVLFTFGIILVYVVINLFEILYPNKHLKFHFSFFILVSMISIMFAQFIHRSQDIAVFTQASKEYIENIFSSELSNPGIYSKTSWGHIFVNTLSSTILLTLATPGIIHTFKDMLNAQKKTGNLISQTVKLNLWIFVFFGMYYFTLIVAGILLKSHYLMPQRVYVLLQVFSLAYLSGYTLRLLLNSGKRVTSVMLILLVFLAFFSQTTIIAGFESSLFLSDTPFIKTYYTPQEITSGVWISSKLKSNSTVYASPTLRSQSLLIKTNSQKFLKSANLENIPVSVGEHNFCRYYVKAIYNKKDIDILYFWIDKYDNITGVQPKYSGKFGSAVRCHVALEEGMPNTARAVIYSNNIITVLEYYNHGY